MLFEELEKKVEKKKRVGDWHEERVIGGIKVYWNTNDSAWLNNLARSLNRQPFPISKSLAVKLPKGYGVWILPDKQGFSVLHIYVHGNVTVGQLEEVVKVLEKEAEKEAEDLEKELDEYFENVEKEFEEKIRKKYNWE